ncbi:hypothetical protein ACWD6I_08775 [Streptomyces sp. NPDC002454]
MTAFLTMDTAPILRGTYNDSVGRELYGAVGGIVAIAGICAYDSDAQGLAQRYFHQALRLAKASGDRAFGAYVIALLVNQSLFTGELRQAVAFTEAALRAGGRALSPALACGLHAMQAKAYSRMGDQSGAHQAMAQAETAAQRIRREEEPDATGYVEPGLLETAMADSLMRLGDTTPACEYASEAVAVQTHARGRVHRLATLSDCELRAGRVDRAADTARSMLETMQGMESHRLTDRLVSVRTRLAATRSTTVQDVVHRIDDTLRIPL